MPLLLQRAVPNHRNEPICSEIEMKVPNNVTFFSGAGDDFWTFVSDEGAGRRKEAGRLGQRAAPPADWLQQHFILTGKQQAPEVDEALLGPSRIRKREYDIRISHSPTSASCPPLERRCLDIENLAVDKLPVW